MQVRKFPNPAGRHEYRGARGIYSRMLSYTNFGSQSMLSWRQSDHNNNQKSPFRLTFSEGLLDSLGFQ